MIRGLLLLLFLLSAATSVAQFTDSTQHLLNFSSTGIMNRTNEARSYIFNNGVRFGIRKKRLEFNSGANWIYGAQASIITNNDFSSYVDANLYRHSPNFYYWVLGTFDKSLSLRINNRVQTGAGVAYNFINKPEAYINLSNGLIYETSNLLVNDTLNDIYQTLRNSMRLRFKFVINEMITLESTNFWQPSLSDKTDYILRNNANLSFKLYRGLSFTSAFTYNKVNRTDRENLILSLGLSYERYF